VGSPKVDRTPFGQGGGPHFGAGIRKRRKKSNRPKGQGAPGRVGSVLSSGRQDTAEQANAHKGKANPQKTGRAKKQGQEVTKKKEKKALRPMSGGRKGRPLGGAKRCALGKSQGKLGKKKCYGQTNSKNFKPRRGIVNGRGGDEKDLMKRFPCWGSLNIG